LALAWLEWWFVWRLGLQRKLGWLVGRIVGRLGFQRKLGLERRLGFQWRQQWWLGPSPPSSSPQLGFQRRIVGRLVFQRRLERRLGFVG
jgi:hypothetical protein